MSENFRYFGVVRVHETSSVPRGDDEPRSAHDSFRNDENFVSAVVRVS